MPIKQSEVVFSYGGDAKIIFSKYFSDLIMANIKIVDSIYADLILEDINTEIIYCRRYWPGVVDSGDGGLFAWDANSKEPVDNGIVFNGKGKPVIGRWVRYPSINSTSIDNFGAIGQNRLYNSDLTFTQSGVPQILLSSKFQSLSEASQWYSLSGISSLSESLNSAAIQQAHLSQPSISIPSGCYWLNRSIEYASTKSIAGEGVNKSALLFESTAGAGFKPLAYNILGGFEDEIYKKYFSLSDLSIWSNATDIDYNTGNPVTLPVYDQAKSGFYCPSRKKDGAGGLVGNDLPQEAYLGFPLLINCTIKNLFFGRFAGDGIFVGNQFSCAEFSNISCDKNAGFGFTFNSNIGSKITNSFMGRFNQLGGWSLPFGATMVNCNGIDTFNKNLPWAIVGKPNALTVKTSSNFIGCNFEGAQQALRVYGASNTEVNFDSCQFQWFTVDINTPFMEFYGSGGRIRFSGNTTTFPALGGVNSPDYFMKVRGEAWDIESDRPLYNGSILLQYINSDSAGNSATLGYGSKIIPSRTGYYPGNADGRALYGEYLRSQSATSIEKIYVGRTVSGSENMAAIGSVNITTALPTTAATPGIYLNTNTAATRANLIFAKVGKTNTGWTAI